MRTSGYFTKARYLLVFVASSVTITTSGGTASAGISPSNHSPAAENQSCSTEAPVPQETPCSGVRPGASLSIDNAYGCTMNFLFQGSDGHTYVGTGGHCIFDGADVHGERTWRAGQGMQTHDGEGNRIGETAFWILQDASHMDFALIRLDPRVEASPQMCHFGGPTGVYKGISTRSATINFFSSLSEVGKVLPARNFVAATGFPHRDRVDALVVAFFGDSGGPATLSDGRALGVAVAGGFGFSGVPGGEDFTAGNVFLVRLPPQIKAAEKALKIDLKLLEAERI